MLAEASPNPSIIANQSHQYHRSDKLATQPGPGGLGIRHLGKLRRHLVDFRPRPAPAHDGLPDVVADPPALDIPPRIRKGRDRPSRPQTVSSATSPAALVCQAHFFALETVVVVPSPINCLANVGIPCGPVNDISKVATDPQIAAREMIIEVEHPVQGKLKVANTPFRFSRTQAQATRASPDLGENTGEVLARLLSKSDEELQQLGEAGAI